jgi:DNA replicative helicase MCM subunit Mcm2 (Cdc46/Mcm family)
MSTEATTTIITEFQISDLLKSHGVSRIAKEGSTIVVQYNDQRIRFDIDGKKWYKTAENFEKASKGLVVDQETKQAIISCLSDNWLNLAYNRYNSGQQAKEVGGGESEPTTAVVTVAEAKRRHSGRVTIIGMIVSVSELYQLVEKTVWKCCLCDNYIEKKIRKLTDLPSPSTTKRCPGCENNVTEDFKELHEYINAVTITIQNNDGDAPETTSSLDGLSVIVFEKDTEDIHVGENVKIIGIIEKVQDRRSRKYHSVLLAESVEYEHRRKLALTHNDIQGIKRFAGKLPVYCSTTTTASERQAYLCSHKERLVKIFAPNVIGHEDKKFALILSMIGAPENGGRRRGRIHALLIGPPAVAKTKLSREVVKVRQNSRYVSAKNTTGKSLTAMILKEEDNYVLNLGPVPLAKNAVCVINEFDKMYPEEQDNLLDVMEEGEIIVNKFAKLHTIKSPTTIVATANPRNNKWKDSDHISLDEIPFESTKLSRFDIALIFRDIVEEQENRKFAYQKTEYDEKDIKYNYNFLEKFIECARTINPVIITEEARSILNEYWVSLRNKKELVAATNRTLESVHRIAKSIARLYICNTVDIKIAYETIEFMNNMLAEFHGCIYYVPEPRSITHDGVIDIIQQQKVPIDLIEAVRMICRKNDQVRHYIGNIFQQNKNKKIRALCNKIVENKHIQIVQSNPTIVRWIAKEEEKKGVKEEQKEVRKKEEEDDDSSNNNNPSPRDLSDLRALPSGELQIENEKN